MINVYSNNNYTNNLKEIKWLHFNTSILYFVDIT